MAFSLTWLAEVLQGAGLKVAEQPGWRDRGRGEMGTVRGVICHHTAGPKNGIMPSLGIVTNGRPDLAGPLAQLCLGRDGTYFIVAAGRCNHAGAGNWQGVTTGNSSFIGIEAENTGFTVGPKADPWPPVQMDAYRRGVAAILTKIGANPIMCAGHKEYALPQGRKDDPSFDMNDFRVQVSHIMAGIAPAVTIIPADDGAGRPTLRRGAQGDLVRQIQTRLALNPSGDFDAATEAAVRQFQRDNGLVPDGIVGPRTWATLQIGAAAPARPVAPIAPAGPAVPPVALVAPPPMMMAAPVAPAAPVAAPPGAAAAIAQITGIAAASEIARFPWPDRGVAPKGYMKGMALCYARVHCKLKGGDPAAVDMAHAKTADAGRDALAWYSDKFSALGMSNDTTGPDTLRHLFVLLIGLGMRESSGRHCVGRDTTATNTTADTAEAGLFQTSFNATGASPLMRQLFDHYRAQPAGSGFLAVFSECPPCGPANLQNFGQGEGQEFQRLCKECPAFAAEYAAVGLRHIRTHWGPITRREAQVMPAADAMLRQVQALVDATPALCAAVM